MRCRIAVLALLVAMPLSAADWRTYSGGFSTRWKTAGAHGHDQAPCGSRFLPRGPIPGIDCDAIDFGRANLDNSIGFRIGRENDFARLGPLRLVGGAEGSVSHTEYNYSQLDFAIFNGSLLGGADVEMGAVRAGVRVGGGVFITTDRRRGVSMYRELSVALPVRPGAALRISRRQMDDRRIVNHERQHDRVAAAETAVMFVAMPDARATSHWDFAATSGTTRPGFGPTQNLALHSGAYHRLSAFRDFRSPRTQVEIAWTSTAHESKLLSDYRGYPDNQRGKTINGVGLGVYRNLAANERISMRCGAGVEVADWRDPYPLLVWGNGHVIRAGVETAMTASGAIRYRLGRGLSIEANAQQLYWRDIHLGETRWGIGIALTR